ncbi:recombinase family protein [Roseomonas sp. HF4]|uniref:recombinase family protein n=1 Tax=Roseomonas sp. HF4 TaxID=2562313 RepID=UPI0010BFCBB5|nr:recombinase family protein [Roseomonas sp. HF4]
MNEQRRPSTSSAHRGASRRCAIYTRKSSDEGLDQVFNSLDAQREACEAYASSQRHEGWLLLPTRYDDGGLSGGNLERPGLQRLLADIGAGKVDLVLVYKVDRLTRSLPDFARIVEVMDEHGASFVSVTQHFNTATSMGRLTLNMLLSFAQFEREVAGERIRDKIAASKRKGMWMGGSVPLGYVVRDRKLVVDDAEAERVRYVFRTYHELGAVRLLHARLDVEGVASKSGQRLSHGALFHMLQNRVYRGEVRHKGNVYPGEHEAIIDLSLWDAVQTQLAENRVQRASGSNADHPSLLAGLAYEGDTDTRLTPTHAVKAGKRYRYYVSQTLIGGPRSSSPSGRRVPASDLEQLVIGRLRRFLADEAALYAALQPIVPDAAGRRRLLDRASRLAQDWPKMSATEVRQMLRRMLSRVSLHTDRIDLHVRLDRVPRLLTGGPEAASLDAMPGKVEGSGLVLSVQASLRRAGKEIAMVLGADPAVARSADPAMMRLILRARSMWEKVQRGEVAGLGELAAQEGVSGSYASRLIRLAFLAPDILTAIMNGRQPVELSAAALMQECRRGLPLDWQQQRDELGCR